MRRGEQNESAASQRRSDTKGRVGWVTLLRFIHKMETTSDVMPHVQATL